MQGHLPEGELTVQGTEHQSFWSQAQTINPKWGQQFGGLSALKAAAPLVRVRAGSQLEQGFLARVVLKVLPQACKYVFPSDLKGAGCCADVH